MRKSILCKWKSNETAQNRLYFFFKIDFKIKTVTRDKEGHYITIKGSIQEEDVAIENTHAPNIGAPQYGKCQQS